MAKKSFSMNKTAVEAFEEAQEKKAPKAKTTKKPEEKKPKTTVKAKGNKLPKAELDKMKTDFDPPRAAVDPGQTELFKDDEKPKKQMGQPRKYNEPLKRISFALPSSAVEKLDALAAIHHINKTQFILGVIETAASESAEKIEKYKKL